MAVKMQIKTLIITFTVLVILCCNGCSAALNKPPVISEIITSSNLVYPRGTVELECIARDSEGDSLSFKWSSTDGEINGSGPAVTWRAPNKYGDVHIIVTVEDEAGKTVRDTITIGVVVNENSNTKCCD
jgi:hypothetical protein